MSGKARGFILLESIVALAIISMAAAAAIAVAGSRIKSDERFDATLVATELGQHALDSALLVSSKISMQSPMNFATPFDAFALKITVEPIEGERMVVISSVTGENASIALLARMHRKMP